MAMSAIQALKREKRIKPDDCFIDDEWMKSNSKEADRRIGF